MIIKILGVLDILAGLIFWIFAFFGIIPNSLLVLFAFYLLVKGAVFLFSKDIASIIDVGIAFTIFLSLSFVVPKFIIIIISLYLIQKGVLSLIS